MHLNCFTSCRLMLNCFSFTFQVSARTAIIDFTVTMKGLEEQLLGRVINTEKEVKRSLSLHHSSTLQNSQFRFKMGTRQIVQTIYLILKELEAERVKLMEDVTSNKRKMKELEDNLLYRLTSTQVSCVLISFCVVLIRKYFYIGHQITADYILLLDTKRSVVKAAEVKVAPYMFLSTRKMIRERAMAPAFKLCLLQFLPRSTIRTFI